MFAWEEMGENDPHLTHPLGGALAPTPWYPPTSDFHLTSAGLTLTCERITLIIRNPSALWRDTPEFLE